jgi:hypothetical protein
VKARGDYWLYGAGAATLAAWLLLVALKGFLAPAVHNWLFEMNGPQTPMAFQIDAEGMSQEREAFVKSLLTKHVLSGSRYELTEASAALARSFPLKSVHLLRTSKSQILAKIKAHSPMVRIPEIQDAFATSEGLVFVDSESKTLNSALPPLSGAVETRSHLETKVGSEILISETERQGILEAALLLSTLQQAHVPVRAVSWDGYRGLSFEVHEETKVVIGMAPFDEKLKPLLRLISDGKLGGYRHIELDFNGKIFAKRKV